MSLQLNELMLRYAQDNQISNVLSCLSKGADVDYKEGALLLIAVYLQRLPMLKAILSFKPKQGLKNAIIIAESLENDKMLIELNEYVKQMEVQ